MRTLLASLIRRIRPVCRTGLLVLACVGLVSSASAQSPPPPFTDSKGLPQGEPQSARIQALLDAVNSGARATVTACVHDNFSQRFLNDIPAQQHIDVLLDFGRRAGKGGYELHGLRTYDPPKPPTNRTVIIQNRLLESWEAFVIEFEPADPYRIDRLSMSLARPPAGIQSTEPLSIEQATAELKRYLDHLTKGDAFSGSAILAKDGKPIFTYFSGEASKAFAVPINIDTKFNLGSMNKMFTAVATAQLIEANKLTFDDPIGKHLGSDWLASDARDTITVVQLLSHTSGLGSHFTNDFWQSSRDRFRNLDDFKPLVVNQTPSFEPGTNWQYSNAGFLLLGAIIEKVSGETYDNYVDAHILKPAGMTGTGCFEMDIDTPNLAIGYSRELGPDGQPRWVNNIFKHVIKGGPAGGGFSTAPDLLRFDQALRQGKLVSTAMLDTLFSPKPASPDYGYGFQLDGAPNHRVVGHSGGFPGINSQLDMHLDSGFTFIVMSNYDDGAAHASTKCRELLARVK